MALFDTVSPCDLYMSILAGRAERSFRDTSWVMSLEPSATFDLVELTHRQFEAASRRDLDAVLSFYASDAVWEGGEPRYQLRGRGGDPWLSWKTGSALTRSLRWSRRRLFASATNVVFDGGPAHRPSGWRRTSAL